MPFSLIFRLFFYRLCDFAILRHIHAVLLRQTHNLINQTIHLGLLAGFHIALHRGRRGRCKRIQNVQVALDQLPRPALQRNTHLVRQRNDLFYQAYEAVAHLARMLHFRSFRVIILSAGRIRRHIRKFEQRVALDIRRINRVDSGIFEVGLDLLQHRMIGLVARQSVHDTADRTVLLNDARRNPVGRNVDAAVRDEQLRQLRLQGTARAVDVEHRNNHRVPVVAGTGSNDTAYAIELTKFAAECGADAGLSVTPYYNKTTQRGLIAHYTAIADCCDLPIVLYNVPSRTGVSFTADTLYELSKHPNINGLKAASGNFSLLAETMAKCGDNLNVWSGNDDQIVPLMSLGGKGVISVLSNVAPQVAHDITQLCLDNRYPEAAKLQLQYHDLIDALFCEVNPIPVKKAMELLGWKVGGLRLPLVEPSEEHIAYIKRELENAGCKI